MQLPDELDKDGVIQRFEFTFELLWKTPKLFLADQGILEAFQFGLLENEDVFLNMLDNRNLTSHIYNRTDSEKIFERIKNSYVKEIGNLLTRLKNQ
ncbi:MAG: HI0074 family nucleotidyltransferase substrate-binding subunit [Ignavibacteria bacterium]